MRCRQGWIPAAVATAVILMAGSAAADAGNIYQWRDENGVLRFSNRIPETVPGDRIRTIPEIPHDAEADRLRKAQSRKEIEDYLENRRRERLRREAEERRLQAEEEKRRRLEAERRAEEARRQAELEAQQSRKSWAKKVRTRPPEGQPDNPN